MQHSRYFRIDWVLVDQLAIGPAPRAERHLDRLREAGIRCILSLCAPDEATPPTGLSEGFRTSRYVLPDHVPDVYPPLMNWKQLSGTWPSFSNTDRSTCTALRRWSDHPWCALPGWCVNTA